MFSMPFQPIQPMEKSIAPITKSLSAENESNAGNKSPFESYFVQSMYGLNEATREYAGNFLKASTGTMGNDFMHHVPIVAYQSSLLVRLGTVVASKVTSTISSLFQMQV